MGFFPIAKIGGIPLFHKMEVETLFLLHLSACNVKIYVYA